MSQLVQILGSRFKGRTFDSGQFPVFLAILALLTVFILYPIAQVMYVTFTQDGHLTLAHFLNFFERDLFREALWNSLFAGGMAVVIGSVISLPLAFFTVKYDFWGKTLIQTLGVVALVLVAVGLYLVNRVFRNGSETPFKM